MIITKLTNAVKFSDTDVEYLFPMETLIYTGNDGSDLIDVWLKGNKKPIFTFSYKDVEGQTFADAASCIVYVNKLSNNSK